MKSLPKNKTQLAEIMGIDLQQGTDVYTWDLETEDVIVFLVAQDELKEMQELVELMYRVEPGSNHVRKQNCEDRLARVNKVLFKEKRGYILVRADSLPAETRDSHQWKLVNGLTVYPIKSSSVTMGPDNRGENWVGWLEFDYINGTHLTNIL
ncbi:hypothetical protein JCM19232_202 [Vibrio ishigakensis]|uniref:Uncharacterized protein n=1 Tax=Vibrio ishigakensis TaxID=1481914 RepID=A0A0B8PAE3_9VIBR|nr:hypothetical protein [Vibrio ishigakensis]GAM59869.1 hypothetical protein JCM19232_202 [Vibrio ishigakensis]